MQIEQGQKQAVAAVNSAITATYWHMGKRINEEILHGERAEYGKQVIASLAKELVVQYGKSFEARNLRRMMQFAEVFPDFEIVSPLVSQLSWTHFTILITLQSSEARSFYARQSIENNWSKRELQRQMERKIFERSEIADTKLTLADSSHLSGNFKDPYFLDFLGLKEGYLENELENALLRELELFILELGKGFAFVERQKRLIIDGEDFYLDLLFFHRKLRRLVVIELKIDRFKAAFKGQMELYLNWLNKHERQQDEEAPIGLILCAEAGKEQVELLNMRKDNIMVAEYWTELPPKELLEKKLQSTLIEVRERLAERRMLSSDDQNENRIEPLKSDIKKGVSSLDEGSGVEMTEDLIKSIKSKKSGR
ncbi:PDDEXK nuclease domain-containing protein [Desulforhopalus sp. 52FAK]